jgi:hypothetical protein
MARRNTGAGWVVLGLLVGGVVGAVLRVLLYPVAVSRWALTDSTAAEGDGPAPHTQEAGADRLRQLGGRVSGVFAQGRASAVDAGRAAGGATSEAAGAVRSAAAQAQVAVTETTGSVAAGVKGTAGSLAGGLAARWREAVAEGRQVAAEKEAQLRRRYHELTHPAVDTE